MNQKPPDTGKHSIKREPKFCKCRVCHEYFYADTIDEARHRCLAHIEQLHPDWTESGCYCPDY